MQTKAVTIRLAALDGQWQTVGSDGLRGIWPENDSYSADSAGPSKCSFDLRRDPGSQFPDLSAWTPIEVEIGGRLLWDGRINDTPIREAERVVNVQGEGWQYHLDDDTYQRSYVHANLSDYKDLRTIAGAELGVARLNAAGTVTVGNGQIYMGWPNGTPTTSGCYVGVVLDLGEASKAASISIDWESSNSSSVFTFYARTASTATNAGSTNSDAFTFLLNTGPSGTTNGTFSSPQRFVQLFIFNPSYTGTTGADDYVKLNAVRVFTDDTYRSGAASVLKAPVIIRDALLRSTVLLSDDLSGVDPNNTVSFSFPYFNLDGDKTAREVLDAANAVHNYRLQVAVGRRVIFEPRPSAPRMEIGQWPGSEFDDASANSGDDIYSRVKVLGTAADGSNLVVERSQAQQPGVIFDLAAMQPTNPSAATNTTGWTATVGAISRDTTNFDTSPGSFKLAGTGLVEATGTMGGMALRGQAYTLTMVAGLYSGSITLGGRLPMVIVEFGDRTTGDTVIVTKQWPLGSADPYVMTWTPLRATTNATVRVRYVPSVDTDVVAFNFDSLVISSAKPTLVERRGFRRTMLLPVQSSLTPALGAQIGDTWLAAHKTTPLKGTVKVTGDQATREILTGASFAPERFLAMTGELLRLSHRIDPDTGGRGRDGRIAEVTYSPSADEATIALDSSRTNYAALLSRLSIVVGSA